MLPTVRYRTFSFADIGVKTPGSALRAQRPTPFLLWTNDRENIPAAYDGIDWRYSQSIQRLRR